MRRIVFIIIGLFALFTIIRAYSSTKTPEREKTVESSVSVDSEKLQS